MSIRLSIGFLLFVSLVALPLISCGANSPKHSTPSVDLLTAIDKADISVLNQHIDAGTDLNNYPIPGGMPFEGAQPLHLAVLKNDSEIVNILLANGADIDIEARNKDRATPLQWAVFFQKKEMVSLLIASGANMNLVDANGLTAMDTANYVKITVLQKPDQLEVVMDILTALALNGGLSASDLEK